MVRSQTLIHGLNALILALALGLDDKDDDFLKRWVKNMKQH